MFSFTFIIIHYRKNTYIQYCEELIIDSVKCEFLPHLFTFLVGKKEIYDVSPFYVSHNSREYILAFLFWKLN